MSTKIYCAYRYDGSIEQLLGEMELIREDYYKKSYEFVKKCFVESWKGEPDKRVNAIMEFTRVISNEIKTDNNSPMNLEASAMVYFHKGKIYVQFFIGRYGEPENLSKNFIDFHYQNQTDMPEEVTDEDWEKRKLTWNEIFGDSGIPARAGLIYQIFGESHISDITMQLLDDTRK